MVGASGTPSGATAADGFDAGPVPAELVAVTVQETGTPFGKPATSSGLANPLALCAPHWAVYEVMLAPPLLAGGV